MKIVGNLRVMEIGLWRIGLEEGYTHTEHLGKEVSITVAMSLERINLFFCRIIHPVNRYNLFTTPYPFFRYTFLICLKHTNRNNYLMINVECGYAEKRKYNCNINTDMRACIDVYLNF